MLTARRALMLEVEMRRLNLVFCVCLALAPAIPAWAQTEQHDHTAKTGAIKAGDRELRDILQSGGEGRLQPRRRRAPLVLVPRSARSLRGHPHERIPTVPSPTGASR